MKISRERQRMYYLRISRYKRIAREPLTSENYIRDLKQKQNLLTMLITSPFDKHFFRLFNKRLSDYENLK